MTKTILVELDKIELQLGVNYNPSDEAIILRFLTIDLDAVKVIWLGQDVYPAKGVATGRSFEVGDLHDWLAPYRQTSMKNIIRLVHKNMTGIQTYRAIKKYAEIKEEIRNGQFTIKPPSEWYESLESQGVLFLNTSFTCEVDKPNSHKDIWAVFSQQVLAYIGQRNPHIKWFLWGREAQQMRQYIVRGHFYESRHPARVSEENEDDFLKFTGFEATKNTINWLG
ncbi:hypothetical protein KSI01_25820 [Kurthia sibirica]|nr:hypothetical protein KSI01_25820 [Kurthia sibirica]